MTDCISLSINYRRTNFSEAKKYDKPACLMYLSRPCSKDLHDKPGPGYEKYHTAINLADIHFCAHITTATEVFVSERPLLHRYPIATVSPLLCRW